MGWPELAGNGRKRGKPPVTHGGRRRRFAGPIPVRPAAVGSENLPVVASGCPLLLGRRVLLVVGRRCLLRSNLP